MTGKSTIARIWAVIAGVLMLSAISGSVSAGVITHSLGNTSPGFLDGSKPPLIFDIINAQTGQPSPFDAGKGSDLLSNLSENWLHSYGAIADTILSAQITIGIVDHDSSASGSQLMNFTIDGNNHTSTLDSMFEVAGQGEDGEYNEYVVALSAATLLDLADGAATINIALQGPGLQTALFGGAISETAFNGAHLIFSALSITTQDATPQIPEPGTLALFGLGLVGFGFARRRKAV